MGLDNGIQIRRSDFTNNLRALKRFELDYDDKKIFDFEVCYWRKCWNVRDAIFDAIPDKGNDNDESLDLTIDDVTKIIRALKSFNKRNWENGGYGSSIWTWEEQRSNMKRSIGNLRYVKHLMKKYGDKITVYFYDSY